MVQPAVAVSVTTADGEVCEGDMRRDGAVFIAVLAVSGACALAALYGLLYVTGAF